MRTEVEIQKDINDTKDRYDSYISGGGDCFGVCSRYDRRLSELYNELKDRNEK